MGGDFNLAKKIMNEINKKVFSSKEYAVISCSHTYKGMHTHDYFELVYVTSGKATQTISDKAFPIKKGDYFIIDYGTAHSYTDCEDFHVINCIFKPEFLDKTLTGCTSYAQLITNHLIRFDYTLLSAIPANYIFTDENGKIRELFLQIADENNNMQAGFIELVRCHIIEILVLSLRGIYDSSRKIMHPATIQIMKYTEEKYRECETLGTICNNIGFSLPYISKIFRQDTGMTYTEFLQKVRIEQSCRLLAETDKSITEIAQLSGYSDMKFFGNVFKNKMNMTPGEFRRSVRGK